MMARIGFALVSLVFILSGCATQNVGSDFTLKTDGDKGLVIGSITRSVASRGTQGLGAYSRYAMLQYRNLATGEGGKVSSGNSALGILVPSDFPGIYGDFFALELPAGNYEFYRWYLEWSTVQISSKKDFSAPFTVGAGKVVYIGDLNFDVLFAKGKLGNSVFSDLDINVKDSSQRDFAFAAKKIPNLRLDQVERKLLDSPLMGDSIKN